MKNSVWRMWTKFVACVELVLIPLKMVLLLVSAISSLTVDVKDVLNDLFPQKAPVSPEIVTTFLIFVWIGIVNCALFLSILLWATVNLLRSTEIGMDVTEASRKARIFRNVTIVFFVFVILVGIISCLQGCFWEVFVVAIYGLWYGGEIYIVSKFIRELEGHA